MSDLSETNALLSKLLKEVSALRSELGAVTGKVEFRDLDDIHSAIGDLTQKVDELGETLSGEFTPTSLEDLQNTLDSKLDELGDRITGGSSGRAVSLRDVAEAVAAVEYAIERSN